MMFNSKYKTKKGRTHTHTSEAANNNDESNNNKLNIPDMACLIMMKSSVGEVRVGLHVSLAKAPEGRSWAELLSS